MESAAFLRDLARADRSGEIERPLAAFNGVRPDAPNWYRDLDMAPSETFSPIVDGVKVEVLAWGERGKPGVLLAHGNRAHARWWGPVAPLLARQFRVVSLSYSGMGGSGWRPAYSLDLQAEEIFAAADVSGLFEAERPPVFVGHSFGARGITQAMAARGGELTGAVLVDSTILPAQLPRLDFAVADPRYDTIASALSRFNLKPPQRCDNLFILDDIARASLQEAPDGWRWRFDPNFFQKLELRDIWPIIAQPGCRLAFVYGEDSIAVQPEVLAAQRRQAPRGTPFVGVPQAGHHLMIDQPFALTAGLSGIIQAWLQS